MTIKYLFNTRDSTITSPGAEISGFPNSISSHNLFENKISLLPCAADVFNIFDAKAAWLG